MKNVLSIGWVLMTFLWCIFPQPIACNEVMKYTLRDLDYIIFCFVPVATNYIPNIVVCADMFSSSVDRIFWHDTTTSGLFGISCPCFASHWFLMGLEFFFGSLTVVLNISSVQML